MRCWHWIFPKTLAKFHTPTNHDIAVIEKNGKLSLLVNGIEQTGTYVDVLFRRSLNILLSWHPSPVLHILVIGVGGGSVIRQLHKAYPLAHIIAVDIDKTIIDIAKTYFQIPSEDYCKFIVSDARTYIAGANNGKFDLIIIDIYIGNDVPQFVSEKAFLRNVSLKLKPKGRFLMNYFSFEGQPKKAEQLRILLTHIYKHVEVRNILRNKVFFATSMVK